MRKKPPIELDESVRWGNTRKLRAWLSKRQRVDQKEIVHQLSRWYSGKRGQRTLAVLDPLVHRWLDEDSGKRTLEISSFLNHADWMKRIAQGSNFCVAPVGGDIEADLNYLPVKGGSVDLIIVCHVLEFVDDPDQFLREVERVLMPQGRCIIVAFNRFGLTGLARVFRLFKGVPWCGRFYPRWSVENWLSTLGFTVKKHAWLLPPLVASARCPWKKQIGFLLEKSLFWMGGLYVIDAQKKVSGMTLSTQQLRERDFTRGKFAQPVAFNRRYD